MLGIVSPPVHNLLLAYYIDATEVAQHRSPKRVATGPTRNGRGRRVRRSKAPHPSIALSLLGRERLRQWRTDLLLDPSLPRHLVPLPRRARRPLIGSGLNFHLDQFSGLGSV
jgi:hypothetical protein